MSDADVRTYLHSRVCCLRDIDLRELMASIPSLTIDDRDRVIEALEGHGSNSAWRSLLEILFNGEEFGLVQLSIAVFKHDADLAKIINRGGHSFTLTLILWDILCQTESIICVPLLMIKPLYMNEAAD